MTPPKTRHILHLHARMHALRIRDRTVPLRMRARSVRSALRHNICAAHETKRQRITHTVFTTTTTMANFSMHSGPAGHHFWTPLRRGFPLAYVCVDTLPVARSFQFLPTLFSPVFRQFFAGRRIVSNVRVCTHLDGKLMRCLPGASTFASVRDCRV